MRTHSLYALYCILAPAAAQLGLSLPPALTSIAGALQSLVDPSDTPTPAPAPNPTPKPTKSTPSPSPKPGPPVQTSETSSSSIKTTPTFTTSIITTSKSQETNTSPTTSSTKTTSSATTTLAEAASTPTETGSSDSSEGLSHQAKVGIGVGIGVFVIVGLLAAALFSFVRDRHTSEAYEQWRENRRNKHSRLGSSATSTSFRGREKEMELSRVEYGNGTVLGGGKPAMPTVYESPTSTEAPMTPDKDLPAPPVAYQQAKKVQIKRKAVPGQAAKPQQKQRFSWMD